MIKGLLFDKDGTLIDFEKTWFPAIHRVFVRLAPSPQALKEMEEFALYSQGKFAANSPLIAGSSADYIKDLADICAVSNVTHFLKLFDSYALEEGLKTASPIGNPINILQTLKSRDYKLGLATNGTYDLAIGHSEKLALLPYFDFLCGYDSGYGRKPKGGMVHGFCGKMQLNPHEIAVIGDTLHDVHMAHDAGAYAIGVASGLTPYSDLAKEADMMINSLEDLLWIYV